MLAQTASPEQLQVHVAPQQSQQSCCVLKSLQQRAGLVGLNLSPKGASAEQQLQQAILAFSPPFLAVHASVVLVVFGPSGLFPSLVWQVAIALECVVLECGGI